MTDFKKQFIHALLAYAANRQVHPEQVCKLSGIDYSILTKPSKQPITNQQIENLWKNLSHLSGDRLIGLHFGESMQLAALGIIGQVVQTSNTVGEALSNAGALMHLITDIFSMQLEHGKKSFTIHLIADAEKSKAYPATYRHMADYLMVFIVHELNGLLIERIKPESVSIPHVGEDSAAYERIFGCRVYKKTSSLSIELSNHYLKGEIISANYELQNYLLQKIAYLLKNDEGGNTLRIKIFNYLLTNSYLYAMSLEAVAANFNISPRSLQRRLKDEGVTFLQIVEEVRCKLAINYLASGNYTVKDVAYTLGYNEQSAFIRAFKRWTGKTPTAYLAKSAKAAHSGI